MCHISAKASAGAWVVFADLAGEMHGHDVAAGFLGDINDLGVELNDIGCLLGAFALIDGQLDLGEHFPAR